MFACYGTYSFKISYITCKGRAMAAYDRSGIRLYGLFYKIISEYSVFVKGNKGDAAACAAGLSQSVKDRPVFSVC